MVTRKKPRSDSAGISRQPRIFRRTDLQHTLIDYCAAAAGLGKYNEIWGDMWTILIAKCQMRLKELGSMDSWYYANTERGGWKLPQFTPPTWSLAKSYGTTAVCSSPTPVRRDVTAPACVTVRYSNGWQTLWYGTQDARDSIKKVTRTGKHEEKKENNSSNKTKASNWGKNSKRLLSSHPQEEPFTVWLFPKTEVR